MSSVLIVIFSVIVFFLAYKFYGGFIAKKIFKANPDNSVPSEELRDDVDYVPTNKEVLFGHHFASIAGTGPIVGPAIAVIWGWVPALIWIIVGSIFGGAVHDYAALIISTRNKGTSIGEISKYVINPRVKHLFLFIILFSLWIVVAIFGMVMAVIFQMYPQAVFPVWIQIPIAVTVGYLAFKKKMNMTVLSVIAVVLMYLSIGVGVRMPLVMPAFMGINPMSMWIIVLFLYAFVAAVLPVWTLLQPRDYVNSHQLIIGLALLTIGIFAARPEIAAPAINLNPQGAPPILPFIFITIACGAISGFHSLVGSGTTSKQLKNEADIKFVGYGGMLTEGFLGILVIVAVTAGIGMFDKGVGRDVLKGVTAWSHHYSSWAAAKGLTVKVTAFVDGSANILTSLGIPIKIGQALMGVLIASFAGTTLDTATRIQRYFVNELGEEYNIKLLKGRYSATAFAVLAAAALAFAQGGGKGALMLWPLFGTCNQLLAGIVLLVASVYLVRRGVKVWVTAIPMVFMVITSSWAMVYNVLRFSGKGEWHLVVVGGIILALECWMVVEAVVCVGRIKGEV